MECVVLKEVGPNKVKVISIVRAATGTGLKESKDIVDAVESGTPQEIQIVSGSEKSVVEELLEAGAVAVVKEEIRDRYEKFRKEEEGAPKETISSETVPTSAVDTMDREETMRTLYEVGKIAEEYEELKAEKGGLSKNISAEKTKAEALRNVVSPRAKRIKWIAILCTVPVWMIPPVGVPLTIIVWIIMNKTVIKKDLAEHEAENNANVENYLKEHVAPLEAREQELTDKIEALHTSGKLNWARDIVGAELFNGQSIGEIYDLLKNRRADNLKEALNLYDDNQHKARMEASQAAIQNATEVAAAESVKQTAYAKETAKNSHQAATAAKASAYHTRQVDRNTRRFR